MISIDEMTPTNYLYNLEKSNSITIDPKAILKNPTKVGLEVHALNMINKAVESLFGKQYIDEETLQSVYKLSLSGKHINSSDTMFRAIFKESVRFIGARWQSYAVLGCAVHGILSFSL